MFRRIAKEFRRRVIARRVRYWGDMIEHLDNQKRNHEGNMAIALNEAAAAKRELAALDMPPQRSTHAPGAGPRDGVVRFSLVHDAPPAKAGR